MAQLSLVSNIEPLPQLRARALWRTSPERAFVLWIRTQTYSPNPKVGPRYYSAASQESYLALFRLFLRHLDNEGVHLLDAECAHIDAFLSSLKGRQPEGGASLVTVRRTLNVLDRVYIELVAQKLKPTNPVKWLVPKYNVKEVSSDSTVLDPTQHDELIEYVKQLPRDTFEGARRAALLALSIGCGITGEDLRLMRTDQMKMRERPPYVSMPKTQSRPEARIPLPLALEPVLRDYRALLAGHAATGTLLFPTQLGADVAVCGQSLHRYAVAALQAVGVGDRIGAQRVLRASFAVRQLAHKPDDKVQTWMRLHTPKMIERYRRLVVSESDRPV